MGASKWIKVSLIVAFLISGYFCVRLQLCFDSYRIVSIHIPEIEHILTRSSSEGLIGQFSVRKIFFSLCSMCLHKHFFSGENNRAHAYIFLLRLIFLEFLLITNCYDAALLFRGVNTHLNDSFELIKLSYKNAFLQF